LIQVMNDSCPDVNVVRTALVAIRHHRFSRSVPFQIGRRHDGHTVGIRHPKRDRRSAWGKLAEFVICPQRQVRLPGDVVDHAEGTRISANIRRRSPGRDAGLVPVKIFPKRSRKTPM
jgi:hypothetical protein